MIECIQTQTKTITDDRSCPNCYYVDFDMDAYPCSRCIRNALAEVDFPDGQCHFRKVRRNGPNQYDAKKRLEAKR